jgi:hypothetical protein
MIGWLVLVGGSSLALLNVHCYLGALMPVSLLSVGYLNSSLYNYMVFCICEAENVVSPC